jgi:hypothetical protein
MPELFELMKSCDVQVLQFEIFQSRECNHWPFDVSLPSVKG